jgi:hypothetical protein
LIEWFKAVNYYNNAVETEQAGSRERDFIDIIRKYEKGSLEKIIIPFKQALLKTYESNVFFENLNVLR